MALTDKIQQTAKKLPPPFQAELLDFAEFLLRKAELGDAAEHPGLSLDLAMRGMEDEETPEYTPADLKTRYK